LASFLPALAGEGPGFFRGGLFAPLMCFLATVIGSLAFGIAFGAGSGPFYANAAWVEIRSFLQLAGVYFLAGNLITNRRRLVIVVWIIILALGLKGVQGIQ